MLLKMTNSPISTSEIKDISIEVDPVYEGILGNNLIILSLILEVENGEFYNQNITQPCRKRGQVKKCSVCPTVFTFAVVCVELISTLVTSLLALFPNSLFVTFSFIFQPFAFFGLFLIFTRFGSSGSGSGIRI